MLRTSTSIPGSSEEKPWERGEDVMSLLLSKDQEIIDDSLYEDMKK